MKKILIFFLAVIVFLSLITKVKADAPVISNLQVADSTIRTDRATVSWDTNVSTDSMVFYVESGQNSWSWQGNDNLSTSHAVMITGLKTFTTYQYYVNAKDANGVITRSEIEMFTTTTASVSPKSDLTVNGMMFSSTLKNQEGTLSVSVRNLGIGLTSAQGLLNWYNNFSAQNFIFSPETPSILSFRSSRPLPTAADPLDTGQSMTFSWLGKFSTAGNKTLQFKVDNANELDEADESNNSFSQTIAVSDSQSETPRLTVNNFKYTNNNVNDQNLNTQIEFDLSNRGTTPADFNLVAWNNTTNFPLEATAGQPNRYSLGAGQTVHVYLLNVNNISHLAMGKNSLTIQEVSLDSQTVYNAQDFIVVREPLPVSTVIVGPTFTSQAASLSDSKMEQLLAEINSLRNTVAEQANQIKYLTNLIKGMNISTEAQSAINNFITYGSDDNTKKLGAGERAAVVYSYKDAYDKLPTTEAELTDVIKIASGRWPSATSADAEAQAKVQFQKIYLRPADMSNAHDNAAVTIMAYGLRQKAINRNLGSEAVGIKTFKSIYSHTPQTTAEWNIMQAVTYSGASR